MCAEFISARPRWWCACLSIVLTLVAQAAYAQRIAGGDNFTLIVTPDGNVWSFGNNSTGQLGHGTTSSTPQPTPTQIQGLSGVQAVGAGINFGLALTTTGTVYAWGSNNEGQLGTTDNIWHDSPVQLGLSNIVAIAAGSRHGVALTATGDVLTWGENNYGQIGNGGTTDTNTPATVFSNAIAIGAGADHTVVIKNDATAWAWGRNGSGRLGNDDPTGASSTTPVQMIGVTDAVAAYGGYAHTVVRLTTGALVATGENLPAGLDIERCDVGVLRHRHDGADHYRQRCPSAGFRMGHVRDHDLVLVR